MDKRKSRCRDSQNFLFLVNKPFTHTHTLAPFHQLTHTRGESSNNKQSNYRYLTITTIAAAFFPSLSIPLAPLYLSLSCYISPFFRSLSLLL